MSTDSETGRLEAFSDGVFAISITLLVLDLHVPTGLGDASLADTLGHQWPELFAYFVSFAVIGILWVNHHAMFTLIRRSNRRLLFTNLALLLFVTFLPFPTSLVAEYLREGGHNAHTAAAVYSVAMLAVSLAYAALWGTATSARDRLVPELPAEEVRRSRIRFGAGNVVYLATVGIAFVSPVAVLLLHFAVAVYYVSDRLGERGSSEGSTQTIAQG